MKKYKEMLMNYNHNFSPQFINKAQKLSPKYKKMTIIFFRKNIKLNSKKK